MQDLVASIRKNLCEQHDGVVSDHEMDDARSRLDASRIAHLSSVGHTRSQRRSEMREARLRKARQESFGRAAESHPEAPYAKFCALVGLEPRADKFTGSASFNADMCEDACVCFFDSLMLGVNKIAKKVVTAHRTKQRMV